MAYRKILSDPVTRAVYEYIRDRIEQDSCPPTLREIARACYIGRSTLMRHLDRLEAYGAIYREAHIARGIRLGDREPPFDET